VGTRWFREAGGMPPSQLAPAAKPPSGRYLSFTEREEIALLRVQGHGVREIARRLGRAPATLSRELRRNAATRGGGFEDRATNAQWHADRAARRPDLATLAKPAKLAINTALHDDVQERLAGRIAMPGGKEIRGPSVAWQGRRAGPRQDRRWACAWSPEQIARRLRLDFPADETMRVGHEAIYQSLYVQGRGARKRELIACRRTGRALRTAEIDAAADLVIAAKPRIRTFAPDTGQDLLIAGEVDLCLEYNGDILQVMDEDDDLNYVVPDEGTGRWEDTMCVPVGAQNPEAAHDFIDYIYQPEVHAAIAEYIRYALPNRAAKALIPEADRLNEAIYPPADVMARSEVARYMGTEIETLYQAAMTRILAA